MPANTDAIITLLKAAIETERAKGYDEIVACEENYPLHFNDHMEKATRHRYRKEAYEDLLTTLEREETK